jgi:hypothetical protein
VLDAIKETARAWASGGFLRSAATSIRLGARAGKVRISWEKACFAAMRSFRT